jgi:molybdate transport system ATP-binding protein
MSGLVAQLSGRRGAFALDARLELPGSGTTVLFGASGSGKTTLLRCIAGLERMDGHVSVGGTLWQDDARGIFIAPERRRVGYVFQEAALLPHLSVARNLDYAARRALQDGERVERDAIVSWLGLGALLERRPGGLSGGERQRVAIARALLSRPRILLMDEPLAALDAGARETILEHLDGIRRRLSIPVLYVTHSVDEAARLGERVAWIDGGSVTRVGAPDDVFGRVEAGRALGDDAGAVIRARVLRHDEQYALTELASDWGAIFVRRLHLAEGEWVHVRARARDVSIALDREERSSIMNVFAARVAAVEDVGAGETLVLLECPADPAQHLLARVMRRSAVELRLTVGSPVYARIKGVTVR